MGKSDIIQQICMSLLLGEPSLAKKLIEEKWPMDIFDKEPKRETISNKLALEVFSRDNFTCRYCGKRTVYLGTLRLVTLLLPDEFPCHPNWKWNLTHPAYWYIASSCDHLLPVARGGLTNKENLVTSCYILNSRRIISRQAAQYLSRHKVLFVC